jgi:hypothetical protein
VPVNGSIHEIFGKKQGFYPGNTPGIYVKAPFKVRMEYGKDKIHILNPVRNPAVPGVTAQIVQFVRI